MAYLAIKGHPTRGKEVIEILGMLGGFNPFAHVGSNPLAIYYIDKNCSNFITCSNVNKNCDCTVFTLEEFLEKFPYKVGDKVNSPCKGCIKQITSMEWDTYLNTVTYKLDNKIYTNIDQLKVVNDLQPCKEETMDRKYNVEEYLKVWKETEKGLEVVVNDRFELKEDNGKFYIIKKQPKYPKTYEECCEVLNLTKYPPALVPNKSMYINQYKDFPHYYEIQKLAQLLVCRNAYWKIAGEQMGLGKPWEPNWSVDLGKIKYVILYKNNRIAKEAIICRNAILAFPTEEMRDAFKENFDDDIDACKELL